jgi:succinate dehydrogenase / fumarate reductase, membrane anchor subunit
MDLRSNLGKARGLGSAHEGAHHWWMQRVTAIALIPLTIWFVISIKRATSYHGLDGVIYLLSSPFNAIAMILLLSTAIYHGTLGIKVIIEDYVHGACSSKLLDIITKFIAVVSIVAVTFSIFYVHVKTYDSSGKYHYGSWSGKGRSCNKAQCGEVNKTAAPQPNEAKDAPVIVIESPQE